MFTTITNHQVDAVKLHVVYKYSIETGDGADFGHGKPFYDI